MTWEIVAGIVLLAGFIITIVKNHHTADKCTHTFDRAD